MLRSFYSLIILLSFASTCLAQTKHVDAKDIFSNNHLSFKIAPSIFNKATITGAQNPNAVKGKFSFGGEAGIDYYKNFNCKNSLIVGLNFGIAAREFAYEIPLVDLRNPPINSTTTRGDDYIALSPLFYAAIPIIYEHRWFKEKSGIFLQIGCNVKFPLYFVSETTSLRTFPSNGISYKILSISEESKNAFKPNIFISLGFGKIFSLKNNNLLKVNLNTQINTGNLIKANYQFTLPTQTIQNGVYNTNGSLMGLSFSYVLTNSNKNFIQKILQKNK